MFVGVLRISLQLFGVSSLKGKRSTVRKIIDRTRAKFNVSVAEVADNDVHRKATIGVCAIGNDAGHVDSMLCSVVSFIEHIGVAPVASVETEVIPMGGPLQGGGELDYHFPADHDPTEDTW